MNLKIALLPGDGIGPEVTAEAVKVLQAVAARYDHDFAFHEYLIGGAALRATGEPLPAATLDGCLASDAVFLGAVGTPEFDHIEPARRPEKGLLALRQALGVFANLRPAVCHEMLADCSPLRAERIAGADLLIVRELLGGLYFGQPRGFIEDANRSAYNTMRYSVAEVERVAHIAFQAAQGRRKLLTSVDKANVLETSRLWRETVGRVAGQYPDVTLEHLYVDACAMHLITTPKRFDVVLTENLFGDILSDEASVLNGSLGMLGSASIGGAVGLYEPVHGSAPDIAGQNIANPLGAIASAAMLLRYAARLEDEAQTIENAVLSVLATGLRTGDLRGAVQDFRACSTSDMGDAVAAACAK